MTRALVAGNWKMNGSKASINELIGGLVTGLLECNGDVLVCPPDVYLDQVGGLLRHSTIALGAQTVSEHDKGAYTGETSAGMLAEMACQYVIVGHSERRSLYGETNEIVALKTIAVMSQMMTPIVCVGETLEQRRQGTTLDVVTEQLKSVLQGLPARVPGRDWNDALVVAYEPVWAIGTGESASPQQAGEVHAAIREYLVASLGESAARIRLLYGGSVKGSNAAELFAIKDINGALVGGASLKASDFLQICAAMP